MRNNTRKKFTSVYYVLQTVPVFGTCGIVFHQRQADELAECILRLTGVKGKVIHFTRSELLDLGYD